MSTQTTLLRLTLPALNEFFNGWNQPVNNNFEAIDTWLNDLYKALVSTGSGSTFATLKGSLASLGARLAVSINNDGTINVANSPGVVEISTSAVDGITASPALRLDAADFERFAAAAPFSGSRFSNVAPVGFPHSPLEVGAAYRSNDFGADATHPIPSPQRPWTPGMVSGLDVLLAAGGTEKIDMMAGATPAIMNIDGYLFRVREQLTLDYSTLAGLANGDILWLFAERAEASYNNATYKYAGPGGGATAAKDLRRLQTGTGTGTTATSTFTATGTAFNTLALGKIKAGDTLVITSGAAAGSYVIDALDGTTPDTKLTIKGKFKANLAGLNWYILDNWHPNIGVARTLLVTDAPAYVAGRVYLGRFTHNTAGAPTNLVTFAKNGVYDSGWQAVVGGAAALALTALTFQHNLGVVPTDVQIFFRSGPTGEAYQPMVERQVATETVTPDYATLLFPSVRHHSSTVVTTVRLKNVSVDPNKVSALFTDAAGADVIAGDIRVIVRR